MIIARYVNRELAAMFLVIMLVLFVVAVGGRFIGYLQDAAAGKYTADALLTILELRLPGFIQLLIPFAAFLAVLLTFGRLYADQEMAVLRSSGAGPAQAIRWMLLPMIGLVAVEGWLTTVYTPSTNLEFTEYMIEQRARQRVDTLTPGVFNVFGRGDRVTYAESMSEDGRTLYNVFIRQQEEDLPSVSIWAERGEQYVDEQTGSRFMLLFNGRRYEGTVGRKDYRVIEFEQLGQRILVEEAVRQVTEAESLGTAVLFASSRPEDMAELHWRIALPVFTLVGILLAVGLSRVKPRQGRFARVLPAMGVLVIYYLALLVNQNAMHEGNFPTWAGFWLVHGAFGGAALSLIVGVGKPAKA